MIQLLRDWSVPGGLLTSIVVAIVTLVRKSGDDKTPTEDVHRAEAAQVARDSGLEDQWRLWAETVTNRMNREVEELRGEISELRDEVQELHDRNIILMGYAWQLRADITLLGHTPRDWPKLIDPDVPGQPNK